MVRKRADTFLRAFGMSSAQAVAEIEEVERKYDLELLPRMRVVKNRKLTDYDQFEHDVRVGASIMSEYYEIFYCLEISIRRLVNETLAEAEDRPWWDTTRVSDPIRQEVKKNREREEKAGITPRSDDNLDYLTFGQLGELITSNFELFETILSSKSAVSRIMAQLNLLRAPIAHCCPLAEDEKERLELSVRDWFRILA
jgi:hypothetical protein